MCKHPNEVTTVTTVRRRKGLVVTALALLIAVGCGYYGAVQVHEGVVRKRPYRDELFAVPCEFTLDATREGHIQVPFHNTFDGLHGCVLCIRGNRTSGQVPEFEDISFMEFSLMDGETVVLNGENTMPCSSIGIKNREGTEDHPLAYLWYRSPRLPHKDYILDVNVKVPRSESACSALPIVVRYIPCNVPLVVANICIGIGIVLLLLALGLGFIAWKRTKRRCGQERE